MTWSDGTTKVTCELCGQANSVEETNWFQGEVGICRDTAACRKRQESHLWDNIKDQLPKGD
jgi:hypothetical protein